MGSFEALLPLVLLAVLGYFLLIRPTRRRAQEVQVIQSALAVDAEVMLTSGFFGRVTAIDGEHVMVEIAPGVVVRPLTGPVPLYPWTMVFRRDLRHPGLDALQASAAELARRERWLELPPDHWIPDPDTVAFGLA